MGMIDGGRAQSAVEYLTTYGWAILIIAIVIAVIFSSHILMQPQTQLCTFTANFTCTSALNSNGIVNLSIEQNTGGQIDITAIGCNSAENTSFMTQISPSLVLDNGNSISKSVQCYTDGKEFNKTVGTTFHGYVIINYTNPISGFNHIAVGDLIRDIE
ncbi:MAG: hypothetical protein M1562_02925 [Candidatus Marsarchaeota archaeon]|jgi:hypothetical protein|nr:hypothetical protein [Candidatus Marsarchaeota archaeon]